MFIFFPIRIFFFNQMQITNKKSESCFNKSLLIETGLYEDDAPVTTRVPQQNLQSPSHIVHTLLSEIQ